MKVTMMLCDHVQAVGGKLFISGGGWSVIGPGPTPFGIALDVKVPWHCAEDEHTARLDLLDADGQPVLTPTPQGLQPLFFEVKFQSEELPAEVKPGTPVDFPLGINFGPQMLTPGSRYEWRLTLDNEVREDWHLAFTTRPAMQQAA